MIQHPVTIINQLGLHARASAKLVSLALRYQSECFLVMDQKRVNAKSIMAVMTLGAKQHTPLILDIEGPDETAMCEALSSLIENRFGEQS
jgi:phosphocarrier protein HPr